MKKNEFNYLHSLLTRLYLDGAISNRDYNTFSDLIDKEREPTITESILRADMACDDFVDAICAVDGAFSDQTVEAIITQAIKMVRRISGRKLCNLVGAL